jgi:hypothetical protein
MSEGAVRYDVRVSDGSRFELEQDEPLQVGGTLYRFSMVYKVTAIRPLSVEESDEVDAIAEVDWLAGHENGPFGLLRPPAAYATLLRGRRGVVCEHCGE